MPDITVELPEPPEGMEWEDVAIDERGDDNHRDGRRRFVSVDFKAVPIPNPPVVTYIETGEFRTPNAEEWYKSTEGDAAPRRAIRGLGPSGQRWILERRES